MKRFGRIDNYTKWRNAKWYNIEKRTDAKSIQIR
jgi:hypothetical protein